MENKNTMYEEIFLAMHHSIDCMLQASTITRNHIEYGSASAFASVLRSMGHEVDLMVYEKDGYILTDRIVVNGKDFDFFHIAK